MKALRAQVTAELLLTARRGDAVLLNLAIPVGLLVFFSEVRVLPLPSGSGGAVYFLTPGIAALAVMSSAMVSLAIATGFERQYGVLKRLGSTPLGRPRLIAAKIAAIAVVEAVQVAVVLGVAYLLGWAPHPTVALSLAAIVLATAAFAGIGLLMAGTLRAELTLAAANGLYLALLLMSGMLFPVSKLPGPVRSLASALPSGALANALRATLSGAGAGVAAHTWIALAVWGIGAPALAAWTFRWE